MRALKFLCHICDNLKGVCYVDVREKIYGEKLWEFELDWNCIEEKVK